MRWPLTLEQRFWQYVEPIMDDKGCWIWSGFINRQGRARLCVNGRNANASRISWELHFGPIPKGEGYHGTCVLHRCDDGRCVNPSHLFLGTQADNMADAGRKKRVHIGRGEDSGMAVLKTADVIEIRRLHAIGIPMIKIRELYPYVCIETVRHAAIRKTWRHLP